MNEDLLNLLYLLSRWAHIVGACLLVGGTLFYELIVPVAIDDLRDEQKLAVFARARWAFRWIVWCSMIALLISGVVSTQRNWYAYRGLEHLQTSGLGGAGTWWIMHTVAGIVGLTVAISLVKGRRPPRYPLVWMRINLMILLVAILMASAARHVRLRAMEDSRFETPPPPVPRVFD